MFANLVGDLQMRTMLIRSTLQPSLDNPQMTNDTLSAGCTLWYALPFDAGLSGYLPKLEPDAEPRRGQLYIVIGGKWESKVIKGKSLENIQVMSHYMYTSMITLSARA